MTILTRHMMNEHYIKAVLLHGRLYGCILVGETGLEDTFENLILSGNDLSMFGDRLLDPDIELDDYFD